MKVTTVDEMRHLDQCAVETYGIPEAILMENAGLAAYDVIRRRVEISGHRFVVLCGVGNNGGDGLVVARKLHADGARVNVFVLGDPEGYRGASGLHRDILAKSGVEIVSRPSSDSVWMALAHSDAVVDALLGTGLTRDVGGPYREVIEHVNACGKPVFSLDIPSGIDGNTGQVRGISVQADHTVTFGLPKRGNLLYPGAERGGRLYVSHISFPPALQETETINVAINDPAPLPKRKIDGHKGTFGDVLFVAGAARYLGAPGLAALSMLKAGGGYARLAAPRSVVPVIASYARELVFAPQPETPNGSLAQSSIDSLLELSAAVDMVVLGPGLSLHRQAQTVARRLTAAVERPLLIDGDGLTAVARAPALIRDRAYPTVLTPHVGEMAKICQCERSDIQADPIGVLQKNARDLGAYIVLKGAHSLVGCPDGRVFINLSGNSGMASAGSGDVLTGTIAAMYGLGLPIEPAIKTGVFMHGYAGDRAADSKGADGLTARDILEALPRATKVYREERSSVIRHHYGWVQTV